MSVIKPMRRPPKIAIHGPRDAARLLGRKSACDAVMVVGPLPWSGEHPRGLARLARIVDRVLDVDESLGKGEPATAVLPVSNLPGGRLVIGCTGRLDRYTDDVRRFAEAGEEAMKRAFKAGAKNPLCVVVAPEQERYEKALEVTLAGALASLWRSVEARQAKPSGGARVKSITVLVDTPERYEDLPATVRALELGRSLCRDITGTEPEVMTPEAVASMMEDGFARGPVSVSIERDAETIKKEYPLVWSVGRGCLHVERYLPRVIRLEYDPGDATRTVFLIGKGVVYDTGGHDIKHSGSMAGMSRDKGGAGAVAGIMRMVGELEPRGVRVVGYMGMVRNAVDAQAYVTDEVLTGRSGARVRVGNTDAEGRLVLADLLAAANEEARKAPDPVLVTIATLTGHAARAVGPYPVAVENGPAHEGLLGHHLQRVGDLWSEPFERSRLRREDYENVSPKTDAEDVVSINARTTIQTPRGHQFPVAFLDIAAGLSRRGRREVKPRPLVHVDIAGYAVKGDWPYGVPTATPVLGLYQGLIRTVGNPD